MVILVEGSDPPPFGLITLGALSPCLFTLQQPLGHEEVNKASSSSAASIKAPARELRSLPGSCKNVSSIRVNGPKHWILQYRSQRDRPYAAIRGGLIYFIVYKKYTFILSFTGDIRGTKLAISCIKRSLKFAAPDWTSLSGTPLVVHPPRRHKQKKRNCSHV